MNRAKRNPFFVWYDFMQKYLHLEISQRIPA